ncbi:MAG TPA: diadenylate cyclase CdaA [Candidatus Omnitrophota bacterium]|nr:diadenylate cyclase CdaA [Candidatus Omnitrophota bacterium]
MQVRWLLDMLDIAVVAVILYYIILWLRGTQAANLLRGLILLISLYLAAKLLGLATLNWLFDKFSAAILVLLIIVFQPELRRTLERLGRGGFIRRIGIVPQTSTWFIRSLVRSIEWMAENRVGAIIVIEKNSGLSEYIESGTRIDALISSELITSVFDRSSPLHDGAIIIQGERIVAAGCLLPLSESKLLDKRLGTRHRAAVGLSEISDALAIVVSESSGTISIAENGYLSRFVTREMLEERLFSMYREMFPKMELRLPWSKPKK